MKALDNKCPSCGANIAFDAKRQLWHCEYCDSDFTLEELNKRASNASSEENNKSEEVIDVDTYTCKNCGAVLMADENTAALFCVYCGNTAIIKNKLTGIYAPHYIIPFKNTKEEIIENFKNLQKGRILMPKFFNNPKNIEKITGVYIPFWLFDVKINGTVELSGTKVTSWTSGDYHYTKTDFYKLLRSANVDFVRIPADGASRFDDELMQSLEPFDYTTLKKYNHAYLAGFLAEKYDIDQNNMKDNAINRAKNSVMNEIKGTCLAYTAVTEKNNNLEAKEINANYVLLPVWMLNINYKNKTYTFAMNGQSGKLVGDIPVHKGKAFLLWLITFTIVMIICTIIWMVAK